MATLDRIEPAYKPWTPSSSGWTTDPAATDERTEEYVGRHRRSGSRGFSLHRMFHTARHRAH